MKYDSREGPKFDGWCKERENRMRLLLCSPVCSKLPGLGGYFKAPLLKTVSFCMPGALPPQTGGRVFGTVALALLLAPGAPGMRASWFYLLMPGGTIVAWPRRRRPSKFLRLENIGQIFDFLKRAEIDLPVNLQSHPRMLPQNK